MSKQAFVQFCVEVVSKDPSLMTELVSSGDEAQVARLAVEKGRAAGFTFDESAALDVLRAARNARERGELTDTELQTVAGGAAGGGGGTPKVNVQDLHFVTRINKSSPILM